MIELVVFIFMMQSGVLLYFYITEREMKFLSQIGIKQCEQLMLTKWKYLFVFSKRKEGIITKHAYVWMIAYYIVNGAGFVILFVLYIAKNDLLINVCFGVLLFANLGLLIFAIIQSRLTSVQEEMRSDYMQKQREEYLRKRRERKQNKLKLKGK